MLTSFKSGKMSSTPKPVKNKNDKDYLALKKFYTEISSKLDYKEIK